MRTPPIDSRVSRRQFIRSATVAVASGPYILKAQSPGRRLNIGFIGTGNKGAENLKNLAATENVAAVCDVDENFLRSASQRYPQARQYRDYRRMLEQRDLEAVVVTVPDHHHAFAAMMAIKLGKHVYCEKPLTHSVSEARALARAARERRVATQMGNGGHASPQLRTTVDWIRAGVIGPVKEVHAWSNRPIWPQGMARPTEEMPVPPHLDWDFWLGPAPSRPYHAAYHPFKWRGWWDFGTGALGDMGCHIIDPAFWALDLGNVESVEAESSGVNDETAPKWSIVRYHFGARPNRPALTLTWYDGGKVPSPELMGKGPEAKLPDNGVLFIGARGQLFYTAGRVQLLPEAQWRNFQPPPAQLLRSPGHYLEWTNACKGGPPALSNFDYSGPLTEMVLLGNVALRAGKRIAWDPAALQVTNVPEANQFVKREYRKGWALG